MRAPLSLVNVLFTGILSTACGARSSRPEPIPAPASAPAPVRAVATPAVDVVPLPASVNMLPGLPPFRVDSTTSIVAAGDMGIVRTAELLGALLRPATGFALPVQSASTETRAITLRFDPSATGEAYELRVTQDSVVITGTAAGISRGTQTLRQLLPPTIESDMRASSAWTIPALTITDRPRFAWRGAMLDVSRHFFTVDEVKQFIDLLALYKLNILHLHLSDDQGWRIEIRSRPRLTEFGAATQVGGGVGGFYSQADYSEIVRYAAERYITVVPEIDMPGHTNAALVAHPELSCSRRPPAPYTGTQVGWSAFCSEREETYALIDDVVRELAVITPGPYIHIGGDEVEVLTREQYVAFVERVQAIVARHGKRMIGWEEIGKAKLRSTSLVQQWRSDSAIKALESNAKIILSPGPRVYLDMKYTAATELGLRWAGLIEVKQAYDWDPATFLPRTTESDIVGVEGPIWSETLRNITAVQYLAVPRLPAIAEVGWSPQQARDFESFRLRIAMHAPRWHILGINYYRSPQIPWPAY